MKKLILLLLVGLGACSKSHDSMITPPSAVKVTITSAVEKDYSGVTELELTVDLENSKYVSVVEVRIYKTDSNSEGYIYPLTLKDGSQIVICPKYTLTSPLVYQIRYVMKDGKVYFSDLLNKAYN